MQLTELENNLKNLNVEEIKAISKSKIYLLKATLAYLETEINKLNY